MFETHSKMLDRIGSNLQNGIFKLQSKSFTDKDKQEVLALMIASFKQVATLQDLN